MKTSPCKGCGKDIVWGVTAEGTKIPLDPRAPVYLAVDEGDRVLAERDRPGSNVTGQALAHYVSHFATCPKASEFGKGRKA